jgi:hypothetical protein
MCLVRNATYIRGAWEIKKWWFTRACLEGAWIVMEMLQAKWLNAIQERRRKYFLC